MSHVLDRALEAVNQTQDGSSLNDYRYREAEMLVVISFAESAESIAKTLSTFASALTTIIEPLSNLMRRK